MPIHLATYVPPMIKRTIYISNPAKLTTRDKQLLIDRENEQVVSIPIEDIGFVILDHYGISLSQPVLSRLVDNNVAIVTTNDRHMPNGMFLNLEGHSTQAEHISHQINAKMPMKKQLWKQTVSAKIKNQANLLDMHDLGGETLHRMARNVKSGDAQNLEAQAARIYFRRLFDPFLFRRHRFGAPPNNALNYGYAILRAVIARSLVGSGLLPTLGIHHHNRYNAYALADDIMEPYRPFLDEIVVNLVINDFDLSELTPDLKKELLTIPQIGVFIDDESSPLMLAATRTTASLAHCFAGEEKRITYPVLCD